MIQPLHQLNFALGEKKFLSALVNKQTNKEQQEFLRDIIAGIFGETFLLEWRTRTHHQWQLVETFSQQQSRLFQH